MTTDYETLRILCSKPRPFPAVIQWHNDQYGFFCGAIPTELADRRYESCGDAVYDLIRSEAAQQGVIQAFQIQYEDGSITKPYIKVAPDRWVKQDGEAFMVATVS